MVSLCGKLASYADSYIPIHKYQDFAQLLLMLNYNIYPFCNSKSIHDHHMKSATIRHRKEQILLASLSFLKAFYFLLHYY